jgi:hypothetical protein
MALFPLIAGGGIVDTFRGCCSETLLKPAWMLNHRCRTNEKEEQTDDARLPADNDCCSWFVGHA